MLIDTPILLNVSRPRYQTTFLLSIHRAPFCSSRLASFLAIGSPLVFLSCRYQDPIFQQERLVTSLVYESTFGLNLGLQRCTIITYYWKIHVEIDIKEKIIEDITLDMDEIIFSRYFRINKERNKKKNIIKRKGKKETKVKKNKIITSNNLLLINARINQRIKDNNKESKTIIMKKWK